MPPQATGAAPAAPAEPASPALPADGTPSCPPAGVPLLPPPALPPAALPPPALPPPALLPAALLPATPLNEAPACPADPPAPATGTSNWKRSLQAELAKPLASTKTSTPAFTRLEKPFRTVTARPQTLVPR